MTTARLEATYHHNGRRTKTPPARRKMHGREREAPSTTNTVGGERLKRAFCRFLHTVWTVSYYTLYHYIIEALQYNEIHKVCSRRL
jgi:hypothetical protein